ncbi:hypothetical protein KUTeg_010471 [Tegillarca granosa]|uniref:Uncharacterized protein n=1 Tax=Tegillarca granosa TaxID=220873 RepID=A0ABQ9F6X8_TEGGR|nr:hypothetical protein KUTeg_010471 [Tegillarca granosa]
MICQHDDNLKVTRCGYTVIVMAVLWLTEALPIPVTALLPYSFITTIRLMLGLMLPTWFLSMWISNTAAASMMVPIISAVTDQVKAADTEEEKGNI